MKKLLRIRLFQHFSLALKDPEIDYTEAIE
jgi:hypothetical protein